MTISEALSHVLHLTLSFLRHNKRSGFVESKGSITTPLGYMPPQRHPTTDVLLEDGIARARKRNYAVRDCKRLGDGR